MCVFSSPVSVFQFKGPFPPHPTEHQTLQFSVLSSVLPDSIPSSLHGHEEEKEGRISDNLLQCLQSAGTKQEKQNFWHTNLHFLAWFLASNEHIEGVVLLLSSEGYFVFKVITVLAHIQKWSCQVPALSRSLCGWELAQNHGVAPKRGLAVCGSHIIISWKATMKI